MNTNSTLHIHQTFPGYQSMPLIGIFSDSSNAEAIQKAGGVPLILPSYDNADILVNLLNTLDGILLAHELEPLLSQLAANRQIPTLIIGKETSDIADFVQEAALFKEAKSLHNRILTLDSHCDTPMFFDQHINFASRDPKILVDLHKMTEGHLDATIMVAYLEQQGLTDEVIQYQQAK